MASNSSNTNNYNDDKNKVETNSNIALLLWLLLNLANLQQMLAFMTQTTSASSAIVGDSCQKSKYASSQAPGKIRTIINNFKYEFPTFSILVGNFVLQNISENIPENWVKTERKKKIKEAYNKGILLPPKCKNITFSSRIKKMASTTLSTLLKFQGVLPSSNIISPTTNSIENDSDKAGDNIDASFELLETKDNA
ncbi:4956_t:CDS:2, partial [Gigaspora rosea]